jgi:hypothetical protein
MDPGTSMLVAWDSAPLDAATAAKLSATPGSRLLIIGFEPVEGGAILEIHDPHASPVT